MPRFALRLAYDGTDFCGWWRQPDQRSVAQVCDEAFQRLGEADAQVLGSSRTDAGVHAEGQVAHVDCQREWSADELVHALNSQLPADVSCSAAAQVADDWHACHLAVSKRYRYELDIGLSRNPLRARFSWRHPGAVLDVQRLVHFGALVPGDRDWSGFARSRDARDDFRRNIYALSWKEDDDQLFCYVEGAGFTYHLVRSLIGAVVACATDQCSKDDLLLALSGVASPASEYQAPAKGLCLESIHYPEEIEWQGQR